MRTSLIFCFLLVILNGFSQERNFISIHQYESEKYSQFSEDDFNDFDLLNQSQSPPNKNAFFDCTLTRRVFGYHPYWGGNDYLNYQWNLISDFCHFSYEVDPSTGLPITTHDWMNSDAIDSAQANNVAVHLCVTLFSGHGTFFGSATAQQSLTNKVIDLLVQRNAQGVNLDIEAVPSAYSEEMTAFVIDFSTQLHNAIPGVEVSMATPAVNWSGTFELDILKDYLDFMMVMCYDYYWNGSSVAGPVSPTYSMTSGYDYSFIKTVSYYQSQGVPNEKILAGVPYYGRQWPAQFQFAPSPVSGYGTAYTYRYVQSNPNGYYTVENKYWEANSFSNYFSFDNNGWHHCFMEDVFSLSKKYDLINYRDIAGIGIWALGYDDGYPELWELIADKFSDCSQVILADTLFDTGGPANNYYNDEDYQFVIHCPENHNVALDFQTFDLETGYDSLKIFDGADTSSQPFGAYSGNIVPEQLLSSGSDLTMWFTSDGAYTVPGWEIFCNCQPMTILDPIKIPSESINLYPNPFVNSLHIKLTLSSKQEVHFNLLSLDGRHQLYAQSVFYESGQKIFSFPSDLLTQIACGVYLVNISCSEFDKRSFMVVKL